MDRDFRAVLHADYTMAGVVTMAGAMIGTG
jgi:hypothetical protein